MENKSQRKESKDSYSSSSDDDWDKEEYDKFL